MRSILKIIGVVTFLALYFMACKKTENKCQPESFQYSFYRSKQLDTTRLITQDPLFNYYSFTINDGNKFVFEYEHHFSDCPEIADDEGLKKIYFEIPMSLSANRFVLDNSAELLAAKCLISLSCECYPSLPVFVTTGSIEGTRLDANSWKIKADLVMPWNPQSTLQFEKVFLVR